MNVTNETLAILSTLILLLVWTLRYKPYVELRVFWLFRLTIRDTPPTVAPAKKEDQPETPDHAPRGTD